MQTFHQREHQKIAPNKAAVVLNHAAIAEKPKPESAGPNDDATMCSDTPSTKKEIDLGRFDVVRRACNCYGPRLGKCAQRGNTLANIRYRQHDILARYGVDNSVVSGRAIARLAGRW